MVLSLVLASLNVVTFASVQEPLRVFLRPSGKDTANETCVARILPVLRQKMVREDRIRLVESEEAAELIAEVDECATYSFRESSFAKKGGITPRGGPGGLGIIDEEYGVKANTRQEVVVTLGLIYDDHMAAVANDGDEKSLKAAGATVAKYFVKWVRANLGRVRIRSVAPSAP